MEHPQTRKRCTRLPRVCNSYWHFILITSLIVNPFAQLTKLDLVFAWTTEADILKKVLTTAPIRMHFYPNKPVLVKKASSDYVSAGILFRHDDFNGLWPVACYSKKDSQAACIYEIYDKELLVIFRSFQQWRPKLEVELQPIAVISDHKNLEYCMSIKQLNRRQASGWEYLYRFNFVNTYRLGKQVWKLDALTRRSGDLPGEGNERLRHQSQTVFKKENIEADLHLFAGSLPNEHNE